MRINFFAPTVGRILRICQPGLKIGRTNMNRFHLFRWALAGGACLLATNGIATEIGSDHPALPAISHYGNLPEDFNRALHETADKIGRPADNPEGVRKLARLYHANRLFAEAR